MATGDQDAALRRDALGSLLRAYLQPLRHHLVRRLRVPADEAEDLLQSFISDKVLREQLVPRAQRSRGRFRWFVLSALNQFVAGQARSARRKKRRLFAGGVSLSSLPEPELPAPGPAESFDVTWARGVIDVTQQRMKAECDRTGRQDLWSVFEGRILRPILGTAVPTAYEELAASLGLGGPADVYPLLTTAKRMFARVLRGVVGEYVRDESEIDEEVAALRAALSRTRSGSGAAAAGAVHVPGGTRA